MNKIQINRAILFKKLESGFTQKQIASELNIGLSTLKLHLKRFGLKTLNAGYKKNITKKVLTKHVNSGLTQRQIALKLNSSQSNIKHHLNKFGLKTLVALKLNERKQIIITDNKKPCVQCKTLTPLQDFYKTRKDGKYLSHICKNCNNKNSTDRARQIKKMMVEYKGGSCERCTLHYKDSHIAVFDFHHINPKEKDINYARIRYHGWDKIKTELDKCKLLCSNCHRITHAEMYIRP